MKIRHDLRTRRLPPGACDCHVHIIEDLQHFPLANDRSYEPPIARLNDYRQFQRRAELSRAVLVQPSVYGFDNRLLLRTLDENSDSMRGVVVPAPSTSPRELRTLHDLGVRGVRVNTLNPGGLSLTAVKPWCSIMRELQWHLQLQIDVTTTADLLHEAATMKLPVVVDHFGHPSGNLSPEVAGIRELLRLLAEGNCWIKFSAAYRVSALDHPYGDLDAIATRCLTTNPSRVLWGSDWPHTDIKFPRPNTMAELGLLDHWIRDVQSLTQILVDNPSVLYGFP